MKLADALRLLQVAPEAPSFEVKLACGFTPLHLKTFLAAHLQPLLPERRVTVTTGLYGDLLGTLEGTPGDAIAIALEWPDLDLRLGFRGSGAWNISALADILTTARNTLARLSSALAAVPAGIPVAISLPGLPIPPLFHEPGWHSGSNELALRRLVADFAASSAVHSRCAFVSESRLAEDSPVASRYDFRGDLLNGFPYTLDHASALGSVLARLIAPPPPRKGLITDLDDTLWAGLVGEIGPENVAWDLASHHHIHGLYQKMLAEFAGEGVLVGIASKNDPEVVARTLQREDLLIAPDRIFPVEAHWQAKSGSVTSILSTWNVAADSVVFVDDSPMELAEVAAAHSGIECIRFPTNDYASGVAFLCRLRDLFGKPSISADDAIRVESVRQGAEFHVAAKLTPESFLERAEAVIVFDSGREAADARALELVNKTNQFNLNGVRILPADWQARIDRPGSRIAALEYQDRFGRLGRIAVVLGRQQDHVLHVETWVMSCRAFSRRIEHQTIRQMFECFDAAVLRFEFAATPKNGPLGDFVETVLGTRPSGPFELSRECFERNCPPLYHRVLKKQRVTHG